MASTNRKLAEIFHQMADILELLEVDFFRVNAFRKVARVIEETSFDLALIGPDAKKLMELEGVGKGMAERIVEFLKTGKVSEYEELLKKVPPGLPPLLNLQGLGPKTIALFWKEAGVTDIESLKAKITDGTIAKLPGMGAKKIENIQKSLEFANVQGVRHKISKVMPVALALVRQLSALKFVSDAAYAGSLRRGRETIGDLDIVVCAKEADAARVMDAFQKFTEVDETLSRGPTKISIRTTDGLQVDVRVVPAKSYGAALLYFTGSKEHNVVLRQRAIDRQMKLNEYGLFAVSKKGAEGKMIAGKTEAEVYKALGLAWIPPELRESHGEVELSETKKLPKLVEISQIKAELHAHTTASDGYMSIRQLVEEALNRGYHTIAVTDHSQSSTIANGLSEKRLEKHILAVRAIAKEFKSKINVLAGSEVDILPDGSLDYPDALLKKLDIVIASPHAALSQDPATATARLIKAINHPLVSIIGHPTGRIIGRRRGLEPDMSAVIAAAKKRGIALEINANSFRLDLSDINARAALRSGVMLSIDTDAHGPHDFDQLIYGVLTARRAGAQAKNIINTLSREELAKWIAGTRKI